VSTPVPLARRLVVTLPLGALAVSVFAFNLPRLSGLDPASATLRARYADPNPDPVTIAALRNELGLNDHAIERFGRFVGGALRGDFGLSYTSRLPVGPTARSAFLVSLQMVLPAVLVAVALGSVLGVWGAVSRGRLGRFISAYCAVAASLPAHVFGPLCVIVCGLWLKVLPTGGWGTPSHVVLPILVLSMGPTASIAEVTRTEMRLALTEPFVRTARSKGLRPASVARHAFAVSRHGVLAIASVTLAGLVSGAVLVETVFSVPGLGRFLVDAVRAGDIASLQCGLVLAALFALIVGALTDGIAALVDPRQRTQTG
jgi:peptide/nickel transport system permease protein